MLLTLPFIITLGAILPLLAWQGLRHARADNTVNASAPTLRDIVIQLGIVQTVVAALAALAIYGAGLELNWRSSISLPTVVAALAALGCVLLLSLREARRPLGPDEVVRARLRKVAATDPAWIAVTVYAGFVEELAYRGVLLLLLSSFSGYWPAAAICAVLFGLAHLSSGWRAVPYAMVFAMAMHFVVFISGGLLMAVAVHVAYDLVAAWLGAHKAGANDETAT